MARLNVKDFPWHSIIFLLSTISMIGLGIAGFVVPPLGKIDPSVYSFASLLCVPIVVSQIKPVLKEASSFKASIGKVSLEAKTDKNTQSQAE